MGDVNVSQATILAGIVIANLAGILGAYVSIRVQLAVLNEKFKYLDQWIDTLKKQKENENG